MERIIYNSSKREYKSHFGALPTDKNCIFNIDILKSENPQSARICVRKDDCADQTCYEMAFRCEAGEYLRFGCEISLSEAGLYFYRFEFCSPEGVRFCGLRDGKAYVEDWLSEWQLTVYDKNFDTPKWAKNKIMYQIFPDRFCHSNHYTHAAAKNDREIINDWFALPKTQGKDFFMGNIAGIIEKLPYIKEMGADIIYLNPIFESPENHRYSTGNYLSIDPYLGTNEDFKTLCEEAKKLAIKIILDGVFSHTGADSLYFNKFGHYDSAGAYKNENSPYYSWYNFNGSATGYECWWGFENLPNVNETNPEYMNFITGDGGVLSYWQGLGTSGWRLDVADELPDEFIDALRKRVKQNDKDALIIGEVWEDATNKFAYGIRRRYLLGRQLDSVMNYPWRSAIIDYIKSKNAKNFIDDILKIEENYPKPAIDCMMNIISTHDTERIINALGVETFVDRQRAKDYILSESELKKGTEGAMMAMFLLFSLPGIACIYYGDEVGLDGFSDPYCRKGYPYGKENFEMLDLIKSLSAVRKQYSDDFSYLIEDFDITGEVLTFSRGKLNFVINMSENDENITISDKFVIFCNTNETKIVNEILTIPKKTYAILAPKS